MRIYIKLSSKLMTDLYQDTCHEGYEAMILGLVDMINTFHHNMELTDYHTVLSKLSFCYGYSENWDDLNQRTIYLREQYVDLWDQVIATTDTLNEIWPQILSRRDWDDCTEYFGNREELHLLDILTR